jgi:hypothetical protein
MVIDTTCSEVGVVAKGIFPPIVKPQYTIRWRYPLFENLSGFS